MRPQNVRLYAFASGVLTCSGRTPMPMRVIQWLQVQIQNTVLCAVLASTARPKPPFAAKFFNWFPVLRRIPARVIGLGVRPEHVRTPEAKA